MNQHRKANILLVEDLYSYDRSLSPRYPSMADWGIIGKTFNRANIIQALLRFDGSGEAYVTLKMKRRYFVSWLRTLEQTLAKEQNPEIIIQFESDIRPDAESKQDVNEKMHHFLEGLLDGKNFLLSSSYSMRGFLFSLANYPDE